MKCLKNFFTINALTAIIVIIDSIVPIVIWPVGMDYFYYPKIIIIYILIITALIVSLISHKLNNVSYKFSKEIIPLVIFIALIIMSALFSQFKYQAFFGKTLRWEGALAYTAYFFIFYFSYISGSNINNTKLIIKYLLFSSCIISFYGILQYFGIDMIPRDFIRKEWVYVSFATLGNPNFLGSYLSIVFPAAVCLFITESRKRNSIALFLISLLLYSALLCTRARSAWVGTVFSLLIVLTVLLKKSPYKIKKLTSLLAVCIIITFALNSVHSNLISSKFKSFVSDIKTAVGDTDEKLHAGSQRLFIWNRTMGYIFENPILGSGPDTFDKVFKMSHDEAAEYFGAENIYVDKAHNEYLQILVTMGFPALISYLYFLVRIIYRSLSFENINRTGMYCLDFALTSCLLAAVLAYSAQAFFNISVVSVAPVFWSVLGLLAAALKL